MSHKLVLNKVAVIYVRVSSKEQEREGFSIPAQLKLLREYALNNNIKILKEFTDSETGGKSGRTNFTKMVNFISQSNSKSILCTTILVEKTDRLYRNFKDYVILDELDLEIHLVKENQVLSKDSRSNEKFIHGIKVLMAKNYIDNLSEEVKKGMKEKAEQGMYPSRAPFGYQNVRKEDKNIIIPDHQNALIVKEIFTMYASGIHSLNDIKSFLESKHVRLSKSSKSVNTSAIHKLLRNQFYVGKFVWSDVAYIGTYETFIPKHLFNKTQEVLKIRGRASSRTRKNKFLFQGYVKCGICNRLMVPDLKKGKYIYYHCKGGVSKSNKCNNSKYIREEIFEKQFIDKLHLLTFNDKILDLLIRALKESHKEENVFHSERIKKLRNKLDKYNLRLSQIYEDKLDDIISYNFYMQKREEYQMMLKDISEEINEHKIANNNYLNQGVHLVEILQSSVTLYKKGNIDQKRKIINFIGSNFSYANGKMDIKLRQPFDIIINTNIKFKTKKVANREVNDDYKLWWAQEESNL